MDLIQHLFKFLTGIEPKEEEPPKPVTYIMPPKPQPQPVPEPPKYVPPPPDPIADALAELDFEAHAMDTAEEYTAYLRETLHDEDVIRKLLDARTPCIPLEYEKMPEAEIPVGASRSGGTTADLPPHIPYPTMCGYHEHWLHRDWQGEIVSEWTEDYEESAMQLLLQLNLEEIPDRLGLLPDRGMLWVFWSGELCDLNESKRHLEPIGGALDFHGDNTDIWKIFYDPCIEPLVRKTAPCPPYQKEFEQPLPSLRVHALPPYYDLDPEKFDLGDYDLDVGSQNDEVNYRGDKLFGFPTYPLNAFPPDEGQQNLLQYDYDSGCLHGLWWYQKKGSFLSDLDFRSDID